MLKKTSIAAAVASAVFMVGCAEERTEANIYTNVNDCVDGGNELSVCEVAIADAKAKHAEQAPQFSSLADCEAEFGVGQCGTGAETHIHNHNGSNGFFFPFFMGYMMGGGFNQPVYRSHSSGGWSRPDGRFVSKSTGRVSVPKSTLTRPSVGRTTVTGRGGFSASGKSGGFGG